MSHVPSISPEQYAAEHTHAPAPLPSQVDEFGEKWKNTNALLSMLGESARNLILQALCTERDRLDDTDSQYYRQVAAFAELYAANLVADKCCGRLLATHAYCD